MCRPATRASAWRAWSNGSTASTWERSVPASTRRPSASSRSRPAVGGERFAGDAPLQPGGQAWQDYGDHPAAVADRADGLVAGLAPAQSSSTSMPPGTAARTCWAHSAAW